MQCHRANTSFGCEPEAVVDQPALKMTFEKLQSVQVQQPQQVIQQPSPKDY